MSFTAGWNAVLAKNNVSATQETPSWKLNLKVIDVNLRVNCNLRPQAMATAAVQDIENHLASLESARKDLEASVARVLFIYRIYGYICIIISVYILYILYLKN